MKRKLLLTIYCIVLTQYIFSNQLAKYFNGELNNLTPKANVKLKLDEFQNILINSIELDDGYKFKIAKDFVDKFGFRHQVYQQYYNDIKINNATYYVHSKDGLFVRGNGYIHNNQSFNVGDTIGIAKAIIKTFDSIPMIPKNYNEILNSIAKSNINVLPEIYPISEPTNYKYCYKITIGHPVNKYYYVDANTSQIIKSESTLIQCGPGIFGADEGCHTNTNAKTVRYGEQRIVTCFDDNLEKYQLHDCSRNFTTINSNYSINLVDYTNFTDIDNNWNQSGEMENEYMDAYALDAHFAISKATDLFETYGINGYDNSQSHFNILMHLSSLADPTFLNAYWNNADKNISVGDGDGVTSINLATIDVLGHEYTHGVMTNAIGLSYYGSNELSAIHEGLADIYAILSAHKSGLDNNWIVGEDIFLEGYIYNNIRNLETPTDPTSINFGPDTYLGDSWDTYVYHQKSLVLSHWFYLLVNGGSGTNDFGIEYNIEGTFDEFIAGGFLLNTLINQGISGGTFFDLKNSIIAEAINEYGICSEEYNRIVKCLYAVGLSNMPDGFSAELQNLTLPQSACTLSETEPITFELKNNSCTELSAGTIIPIVLSINNNVQNVSYTLTQSLNFNETVSIILNVDLSQNGRYFINISLGDPFTIPTFNSQINGFVKNVREITEPITIDFEGIDMNSILPDQSDYFLINKNVMSNGSIINSGYLSDNALKLERLVSNGTNYDQYWSNYISPTFNHSYISSIDFCVDNTSQNLNLKTMIKSSFVPANQTTAIFKDNTLFSSSLNATNDECNSYRQEIIDLSSTWGQEYGLSIKHKSKINYTGILIDNIQFYKQYNTDLELNVLNVPTEDIISGTYPINIRLNNIGQTDITSYIVYISINSTNYEIPLTNLISSGTSIDIEDILNIIGVNYIFEIGQTYNIEIGVGVAGDQNLINNLYYFTINVLDCNPYAGTYIVGNVPDATFTTIQQAIDALVACKINGDVELIIDGSNGYFEEQVLIPNIPKINNLAHTVTLRGINNAKVINNQVTDNNKATIKLFQTKDIIIKDLEIVHVSNLDTGACAHITIGSENVSIENCILINNIIGEYQTGLLMGSFNDYNFSPFTYNANDFISDCNIKNSKIFTTNIGAYISNINNMYLGEGLSGIFNTEIYSKRIGVHTYKSAIPKIIKSDITAVNKVVIVDNCIGSEINRNILKSISATDILYYKNTSDFVYLFFIFYIEIINRAYNNFIIHSSNVVSCNGISLDNSDGLLLYNNSVSMNGGPFSKAFYSNYVHGARIFIKNNSFACFGQSSVNNLAFDAPYIYPSSVYKINNNNLFVENGSNLCKINNTLYNSTDFMNNPQGYFKNSISVNPRYISNLNNLRINCSSPLIDKSEIPGTNQSYVYAGKDIDYKTRNAVRIDIGAFEYQHKGIKAYLEGAYNNPYYQSTKLKNNGLLPTQQPFATLPYLNTENTQLGIQYDSIVDWVLLEARDTDFPCFVKDKTAALLLNNGYIVSPNGNCNIEFPNLESGSYYFVVRHANHQDVMTEIPLQYPFNVEYDFTLYQDSACNSNLKFMRDRTYCMYAGDVEIDGELNNSDVESVSAELGNSNIYTSKDVNLDGQISEADIDIIENNIIINPQSCNVLINESLCEDPCSEEHFNPLQINFEILSSNSPSINYQAEVIETICGDQDIYYTVYPSTNFQIVSYNYETPSGVGVSTQIYENINFKYIRVNEPGNYVLHISNEYGCIQDIPIQLKYCSEICDNNFDDDFDGLTDCEDDECSDNLQKCCIISPPNIPISCSSVKNLVCGCNNITYQNPCIASAFVKSFIYGKCSHYIEDNTVDDVVFCHKQKDTSDEKKFIYNIFWDNKYEKYNSKLSIKPSDKYCKPSTVKTFSTIISNASSIIHTSDININNIIFDLSIAENNSKIYKNVYANLCVPCIDFQNGQTEGIKSNTKLANSDVEDFNEKIKIYPNPANSYINIDFVNNELFNNIKEIEVVDITGKRVLLENINSVNHTIYTNNLANGIYIVNVIDNNNYKIFNQKVVVIK